VETEDSSMISEYPDRHISLQQLRHLKTKFQVGNPYLDDNKNTKGQIDYLWSHGVISDEVWANITKNCKFSPADGNTCSDAMASYDSGYISGYNIYAPVCIDEPNGNYYPSSNVRAFLSLFCLLLMRCYL